MFNNLIITMSRHLCMVLTLSNKIYLKVKTDSGVQEKNKQTKICMYKSLKYTMVILLIILVSDNVKIINLVNIYRHPFSRKMKKSKIGLFVMFAVRMLGIYQNTNIFGNKHAIQ